MLRFLRKSIGLLLAAVLLLVAIPLTPAAARADPQAGDAPLRVEITTCKKTCTLLSNITYTVTVTNISGAAVHSVSAQVLFGRDIVPLEKDSQLTAEQSNLAPGESLTFRYRARINTLRKLDILLFPIQWIRGLFAAPAVEEINYHLDNGREYAEASARVKLLSFFDSAYDAASTVRVRYGYAASDDFSSVLDTGFFEGYEDKKPGIAIDIDTTYYLLLSRARSLTAGMRIDGDITGAGLKASTIRHSVAWTFAMEEAGGEQFVLRSLASGLAVAVKDASAAEGAPLQLESYTGQAHQLWYRRPAMDGQYRIINVNSGKAIDIGGGDALVQRTPGQGASQAWELMPIDAAELAEPTVPVLSSPAAWAQNAIRYPQEGKLTPAGPVHVQWYQDASVGDVEYYELAFDGEQPVRVLPSGAAIMGYRWYTTDVAHHTVRITAVLRNGGRAVVTETRTFPVTKKGIAWGTLHRIEDMRVAWYYNWFTTPCTGLDSHLQFEPQVWGNTPDLGLGGLWGKGYRSVMSFNEPDFDQQANMTAAQAAGRWPEFTRTGLRLGSPAVAGHADTSAWLSGFMDAIGSEADFMVLHIYDSGASAVAVLDIVDRTWHKYRKPIWIKEFAVASFSANSPWGAGKGNPTAVAAFMEKLLCELDKRPYVERYAWYPFGTDDMHGGASALFDYRTGALTALGITYKSAGLPA